MDYFTYDFQTKKVIDVEASGAFLKYLRQKIKMRQNELAELIEVGHSNISHIEAGRLGISDKILTRLVNVFNEKGGKVTFNDFLVADIGTYERQVAMYDTFKDARTYEQIVSENTAIKNEVKHLRKLIEDLVKKQ